MKNGLDADPITLRVVKITLSSGEKELLAVSLIDQQKYIKEDINELYHYRWGVEEGFKNLKPKMKMEQFGTKKTQGICQEFYAHIFCMNLVSLFGQLAEKIIKEKTKHRELIYQYNWQNAFRFTREKIIDWLSGRRLDALIEQLTSSIIRIPSGLCVVESKTSEQAHEV